MAAGQRDPQAAFVAGLAEVLESIAAVQGIPGEDDVEEYAEFDGSEILPLDPDSIIWHENMIRLTTRTGTVVTIVVSGFGPS